MKIKEYDVPVPWGVVAVKAWGNENDTPVFVVHGIHDNAGSFDGLIPCLSETFHYICIDLPGHGKSSHFPQGTPIHPINMVLTLKIVMDYLNREKYVIIAHSWGGRIAVFFTQLYPDYISKAIILDAPYLHYYTISNFKQGIVQAQSEFIDINRKLLTKSPPLYTYEEALKRLSANRMYGGKLKQEGAEALLKRSLISMENGKFRFSTDLRFKPSATILLFCGKEFVIELIRKFPLRCPILFIIASESVPRLEDDMPILKKLRRTNKKCFMRVVEGDHDVHMNQPEVVALLINSFLTSSASKL